MKEVFGIKEIIRFLRDREHAFKDLKVYDISKRSIYANHWVALTCPSQRAMHYLSHGLYRHAKTMGAAAQNKSTLAISDPDEAWMLVDIGQTWVHFFNGDEHRKRLNVEMPYKTYEVAPDLRTIKVSIY
jgi:ribosomal silencing factor RsfS